MKKIILSFFIAIAFCNAINAQQAASLPAPNGQSIKTLSVQEANQLNGVANPTINGMPYSQYKAEQDAVKNQANRTAQIQPQVPQQFKLPVAVKWTGKPGDTKMMGAMQKQVLEKPVYDPQSFMQQSVKQE